MAAASTIPPFPLSAVHVVPASWPRHYACPADWTCDLRLSDFDLWFVLRGIGELVIDGVRHAIRGPQVLMFQPGQRVLGGHSAADPLEVYALHFSVPTREQRNGRDLARRLFGSTPRQPARLQEQCAWVMEVAIEQDEAAAAQVSAITLAILMQLWRDLHRRPAVPGDWRIEALMREISRRAQERWDAAQMAREAGLSESHLTKRFRALTGLSPRQFVIRMRVRLAEALMKDTRLSLAQIADAAGYRDVFFFSRQFKQVKGVAPAAYRRSRYG